MEDRQHDVSEVPASAGSFVLPAALRSQYAEAVSNLAIEVAYREQAPANLARQVRAFLLHKLFHWMCWKGTHILAGRTIERLERLGMRLARRELRRLAKESGTAWQPLALRGPLWLSDFTRLWCQLTFPEQRVLRLIDLKFSREEVAMILDMTVHAVEFHLNQAHRKIHLAYTSLR
jgi:hypothetical protein